MQAMGVTTSVVLASNSGFKGESNRYLADAVKTVSDAGLGSADSGIVASAIDSLQPPRAIEKAAERGVTPPNTPTRGGGRDR